ncbi:unnamed protein product [Lota lota]
MLAQCSEAPGPCLHSALLRSNSIAPAHHGVAGMVGADPGPAGTGASGSAKHAGKERLLEKGKVLSGERGSSTGTLVGNELLMRNQTSLLLTSRQMDALVLVLHFLVL